MGEGTAEVPPEFIKVYISRFILIKPLKTISISQVEPWKRIGIFNLFMYFFSVCRVVLSAGKVYISSCSSNGKLGLRRLRKGHGLLGGLRHLGEGAVLGTGYILYFYFQLVELGLLGSLMPIWVTRVETHHFSSGLFIKSTPFLEILTYYQRHILIKSVVRVPLRTLEIIISCIKLLENFR